LAGDAAARPGEGFGAAALQPPKLLGPAIPWPHIPAIEELGAQRKKTVEQHLKNVHAALGRVLLALVALHLAAAPRQALVFKDGVMSRMLPGFLKTSRFLLVPFALMVLFAAGASPAAAQEWAIDKSKSRVSFEVDAGGQTLSGEFQQFRAENHFDREEPGKAEISAAIDTNTVSTGHAQVDEALLGKAWFDTQSYPSAGFRATSVSENGAQSAYLMEGDLIIKGHSMPVSIPFTLDVDEGEAMAIGETAVNRRNFGLGPDGPVADRVIGDLVRIKLEIVATRLDN
jgi:polyisoprenoid-binding protein YceI